MPTMKERLKTWRKNNREKMRGYSRTYTINHLKDYRLKLKIDVLTHYSNGTPKCACCGETLIGFLSVDHINGGGTEHRKKIGRFGSSFYQWLKQHKYPSGYQVLCYDCNIGKAHNDGICPHKQR